MPVALAARREDRLRDAVSRIAAEGGRAIAVGADVTSPDDCRRLLQRAADAFGPVYAVFANAGYGLEKPLAATTDAEMRAIFETNFFGTLNTIAPAIEPMVRAGAGHILICSSCVSKIGVPLLSAYTATKAAQDHIGRALRIELGGTGVHVSTVHPIRTDTEFFDRSAARSGRDHTPAVHVPAAFRQTPERVADAIVRCLKRPRPEVWTSASVRFAFAFLNAFPRLADTVLRGHMRESLAEAQRAAQRPSE